MRLRKKQAESAGHERWLVSYADFITLMFAFFVVMYAIAMKDRQKARDMAEQIRASLAAVGMADPTAAGARSLTPQSGVGGEKAAGDAKQNQTRPEMSATAKAELNHMQDVLQESLRYEVTAGAESQAIELAQDHRGLIVRLTANAFFDSGAAHVRKAALPQLDQIAAVLKGAKHTIRVEGYTDNLPADSADYASNWELSAARATWVVRYLIEKHRLDSKRLMAAGFADNNPIADNNTAAGRARNRRVELVVVP